MLKLSEAQSGRKYKIERLNSLHSLAKRTAILGLSSGVFIELLALYKHGALIKTPFGNIALGVDVLDSILVSLI